MVVQGIEFSRIDERWPNRISSARDEGSPHAATRNDTADFLLGSHRCDRGRHPANYSRRASLRMNRRCRGSMARFQAVSRLRGGMLRPGAADRSVFKVQGEAPLQSHISAPSAPPKGVGLSEIVANSRLFVIGTSEKSYLQRGISVLAGSDR